MSKLIVQIMTANALSTIHLHHLVEVHLFKSIVCLVCLSFSWVPPNPLCKSADNVLKTLSATFSACVCLPEFNTV